MQLNNRTDILEELKEVHKEILEYDKIIFMFTRVDMMKINSAIDDYIDIEDKLKNSCLVIIGDGPALEHFKNKFNHKKNIFFTGWIDKNDAFSFIKDFNIMIAPHGGYSIIEMGMLGIPTIAYNYDIMSDLIYNSYNGYLVDKNTKEEMKNILIEYFSKTSDERDKMKDNIKNSFYTRFNLNVLDKEKEKIVSKLFGDKDD
jgi:glycosyltransferase involved in cell wall biosynthesis